MSELITNKGKDRRGIARGGQTDESATTLIKRLFDQRWLWAIAMRGPVQVGGIGFDPATEKDRIWWAESAPGGSPS